MSGPPAQIECKLAERIRQTTVAIASIIHYRSRQEAAERLWYK
jgi:hypothetical protein